MKTNRVAIVAGVCLAALLTGVGFAPAVQASPETTEPTIELVVVDSTKIYHGNVKKFKKPAMVHLTKVYELIPAYQYIKENNLTEDDPMYWFKMKEASKVFKKALKKLQKKEGFDLVGEIDSIYREDGEEIPDKTDKVKEIVEEGV